MTQESRSLTVTTPSDFEVRMTRTFDTPRNLVYDAWTKPELLRRWLGREGEELIVCDIGKAPCGDVSPSLVGGVAEHVELGFFQALALLDQTQTFAQHLTGILITA